ncbi:MAG: hypothetical protein HPY50_01070 [Firmicutes bacterium]|nr:hypothetical protein [Bacillota bacterium]
MIALNRNQISLVLTAEEKEALYRLFFVPTARAGKRKAGTMRARRLLTYNSRLKRVLH